MAEIDEKELARAHGRARAVVHALITLSLLLVVLAYAGVRPGLPAGLRDQRLYGALWIIVIFLGLGALVLRRVRFNAARLQAVADARGVTALLASLQKTTVFVAAIGGAVALVGYLAYLLSLEPWDMLRAGVVAVAVLLYSYPRRSAWRRVLEASQTPGGIRGPSPAKGSTA
jgi:hypothetical protein